MRLRLTALLGLSAAWLAGCASQAADELFVNLVPVGEGAMDGWTELSLGLVTPDGAVEPGLRAPGGGGSTRLGPIHPAGPFRLELLGLTAQGQPRAWAFSPELREGEGPLLASLFLTRVEAAVVHAGPALADPAAGLEPEGLPWSLRLGPAEVSLAANRRHLFLDVRLRGAGATHGEDLWTGDALVVALDGLADSLEDERGADDLVLALGPERYQELWNPLGVSVLHDFTALEDGARYFAAVPIDQLEANDGPGPNRRMRLGLELRQVDGQGALALTRWPGAWAGGPAYDPALAGEVFRKTRLLDARAVPRDSAAFAEEPGAYLSSGAAPLALRPAPGQEAVEVRALWDPTALGLAVSSRDETFCAQQRGEGDRQAIQRDDAVELTLIRASAGGERVSRRALFDLSGSTAFDALGGGAWQPVGVDFRFELSGQRPEDDCREGQGWTFLARIPWTELDYSEA
ncbi:MAG TPA: hypothetical protein P5076_16600, partial [Myxococcota bacterium]|nr:hypothetical protein [Myxococcota bacterium]